MNKIKAIAVNTFKECLRQRILVLIAAFAILLILISLFIDPFTLGETPKIIRDVGLATIQLFGIFTVLVIGSMLIFRDTEKRTIYTVIAKPVKRSEIIIGKFFGLFCMIALLQVAMAIIQQLVIFIYEGQFAFHLLASLPFGFLEIMIMISIMLLFSSASSPTLSTIFGILIYLIGHASLDIMSFIQQAENPAIKFLADLFYYVLTNLENFNIKLELVYSFPIPGDRVLFTVAYGLAYTVFALYVAIIAFRTKEFK